MPQDPLTEPLHPRPDAPAAGAGSVPLGLQCRLAPLAGYLEVCFPRIQSLQLALVADGQDLRLRACVRRRGDSVARLLWFPVAAPAGPRDLLGACAELQLRLHALDQGV